MRLIQLTEAEAHGVIEALSVYLQTCREDAKEGAERRCLRAVLHKVHRAQAGAVHGGVRVIDDGADGRSGE